MPNIHLTDAELEMLTLAMVNAIVDAREHAKCLMQTTAKPENLPELPRWREEANAKAAALDTLWHKLLQAER